MTIIDPKVRERVEDEVARADKLLRKVTDPNDSNFSRNGSPALTSKDIVSAPGLVFNVLKKAGIGLGVLQGRGFVIQKLDGPNGQVSWSAPLFFKVTGMTLGAIVGWEVVDTFVIPDSRNSVRKFLDPKTKYGVESGVGIGHSYYGTKDSPVDKGDPLIFSVTNSGAIIDISLKGASIHRDDKTIEEVYGSVVHPEDILDGRISPPDEAKPVYDRLKSIVGDYGQSGQQQQAAGDMADAPAYVYLTYEEYQSLLAAPDYDAGVSSLDTASADPLLNIDLNEPVGVDPALLSSLPVAWPPPTATVVPPVS